MSEITDETNQTKWHDNSVEKKNQYFSFPGTSEISNGKIYLSFRIPNTGIWVINIREDNIKIDSAYQVMEPFEQIVLNGTEEIYTNGVKHDLPQLQRKRISKIQLGGK